MDDRPQHPPTRPVAPPPFASAGDPFGYAPYAPAGGAPFTLREAVRVVRRRRWLVLSTFALTVVAALVVTSRMKPVYTATARILIQDNPAPTMPGSLRDLISGGGGAGALETEMEKIKSRPFLSEVLRKLGAKTQIADPLDLKNRLALNVGGGGRVMDVTVRARGSQEAADVANMVSRVYTDYTRQESDERADLAKSRLRNAKQKAKQEKDNAQREYEAFLRRIHVSDPAALFARQAQRTLDVRTTLAELRKNLPLQEDHVRNLRSRLASIDQNVIAGYSLDKNNRINDYTAQINDLEKERKVRLLDFGAQSEEIRDIDAQLKAFREQLAVVRSDAYSKGGVSYTRNAEWAQTLAELNKARTDVIEARRNIEATGRQLAGLEAEQRRLAPMSAEFQELLSRVTATQGAYNQANVGEIQIDIGQRTNVPTIKELEAARPIPIPVSPKPLLNGIMAVFLGAFLGVGVALLAEYLANLSAEDEAADGIGGAPLPALPAGTSLGYSAALPNVGGVPLLAQVPVGGALPASVATANALPAAVEDAFREVGYVLAHHGGHSVTGAGREAAAAGRAPVILFAGTRSDEATASVAAQLCATLVRDGLRVTLVDADRAQPRLNRVFGAPDAPGVADILAGRVGANDALHIGADGRLRFLSAGAPADTAAETTENGLRALFDDLSAPSDTDLVVVSGPSVWAARQVGPLEKAADGMVLVAPDAVPADESVARARRLLSNGYQPRILGVVVGRSVPGDAPVEALPAPTEVNP